MTQILLRRGDALLASERNPILAEGEPGWETDTRVFKIGDGVTAWNDLPAIGDAPTLEEITNSLAPMLTTPLTIVASKLRAADNVTVALAGDSTGDETAEWWYRSWLMWANQHGHYTMVYRGWDHNTQAYVNTTAQTGGRFARTAFDSFSRVAADIVGSASPRGGANWVGAANVLSLNGSRAVWASSPGGFVGLPGTVTSTVKKTVSGTMNVAGGTSAAFRRINIGMYTVGSNVERLSLRLTINTDGVAQFGVDGQFPTYATVIAAQTVPVPIGPNELAYSLTVEGNTVTAKLGATTITGTLSAGQRTSVDAMGGLYIMPEGTLTGLTIDELALDVFDTATAPVLTVINASRAGSDLTYQQARMATMFPAPIDALWVSSSHNYGSLSAPSYMVSLEAFLQGYRDLHPETADFAVVAQNPEAAPAANRVAHRARMVALKTHAKTMRYALVDFLGLFETNPNWSAKWIRADGVHPTAASSFDEMTDPENGQYQMAVEAKSVIDAALGSRASQATDSVVLSQASYDALPTKNPATLYVIVG